MREVLLNFEYTYEETLNTKKMFKANITYFSIDHRTEHCQEFGCQFMRTRRGIAEYCK